jgi:hypothetical protein
MSFVRTKRPLTAIAIGLIVTSSLAVGFGVPNVATAETIIIESCDPGKIELRSGDYVTCIDPNDSSGGGGAGDGPSPGDPSDDGGHGGSRPRPRRPNTAAERLRKQRCKKCQAASQQCQAQASLAGETCLRNAEAQAADRCNPLTRGANTVTAWGCTIWDHLARQCNGVESPWNDPHRWEYGCSGAPPVQRTCEGRGIESCVASWRVSHPSGSTTIETTGEFTVEFEGVGALADQSTTETFSWNGRNGYLGTCERVAMSLYHSCTGRENACYQAYSCTDADLQ